MMSRMVYVAVLLVAALSAARADDAGMSISSTAVQDGGVMPSLFGGTAGACGGRGISPQISWSHVPAGTRSVVVLLFDIDGANGLGVSHWVAYNIDAARGELKQGEGQVDGAGVTVGLNQKGAPAYMGPCPPVGDVAHHYVLTVIATDLAPGALGPALDRNALWRALQGHALRARSIVGRYAR